jgi:hypothetical protein|tara:strand:- start:1350 stop:1712 length:363 start_codon:yes stop_codon:yes gene_type:complete
MDLLYKNSGGDKRGHILFNLYGDKKINLFEIKQGCFRGGHWHNYEVMHTIISGKIEYYEFNLKTQKESKKIIFSGTTFTTLPSIATMMIGLEDSIYTEVYDGNYNSEAYLPYRNIVENFF